MKFSTDNVVTFNFLFHNPSDIPVKNFISEISLSLSLHKNVYDIKPSHRAIPDTIISKPFAIVA